MSKLIPVNGHIIVRPLEEEDQMYGNIALPNIGYEDQKMGEVIGVSDSVSYSTGDIIPCPIKEKDVVFVPPMGTTRLNVDGEEFWVMQSNQISSILVKE